MVRRSDARRKRRMKPGRVVIMTGNHLCHNPRVMKEAVALARAGWDVEVLGAWTDPALKARDIEMTAGNSFRFTPVLDLGAPGLMTKLNVLVGRLGGISARLLYRYSGVPSRWLFNAAAGALSRAALERKADLYIAHSEAAMLVAAELTRLGRRVVVDFEDWFSEDLLPEDRKLRPIGMLSALEGNLLRQGAGATCPSRAMSAALGRAYGCAPPAVVYNAFPWTDRKNLDGAFKDRKSRSMSSVHWFSQMIGPGRGLEDLLASLRMVDVEAEIHLRGRPVPGFDRWLAALVPEKWRPRVFIHGLVPNEELLSRIAEHDIGFAGEMTFCRNRELTVTNKILQYLLGGLAVVASDTPGQREAAGQAPGAVSLYAPGDAAALARRLNELLSSPDRMNAAKSAALRSAENIFCWERQEPTLLESVRKAV